MILRFAVVVENRLVTDTDTDTDTDRQTDTGPGLVPRMHSICAVKTPGARRLLLFDSIHGALRVNVSTIRGEIRWRYGRFLCRRS